MDIIAKSNLDEFISQFGYEDDTIDKAFEKFVNYVIVSKEYSQDTIEMYQIQQITVGDGGDTGLDGIAILVNGKIVSSKQAIEDLLNGNGYLDVTFILIQSKKSSGFEISKLIRFLNGVKGLFIPLVDEGYILSNDRNKDIKEYSDLIKFIYNKSSAFEDGKNPKLKMYFASLGKAEDNNNEFNSAFSNAKLELSKTNLLSTIDDFLLGAEEIISLYKDTKSKEKAEFIFKEKYVMPEIDGIKEAYYGLLPFSELKIIISKNNVLKNVFYDNVRAFQGYNLVNQEIDKTLKDGKFDLFTALNNGITIVTKIFNSSGHKVTLTDYQIVNGCQTCHVLYHNRGLSGIDNLKIPIRIICSDNKSVRNQIIVATNSQTEVKREQLIALSEFQERIEDHYNAIQGFGKLYYERRSKQYKGDRSVPDYKIITIPIQIMAFTSVVLEEPHNVRGYYGKIIENLEKGGKVVFSNDYELDLYYMSALAYHRLERLFQRGIINKDFRKAKFHLLLVFRLIAEEKERPKHLNDKNVKKYCEHIISKLNNEHECIDIFKEASEIIIKVVGNSTLEDKSVNAKLTSDCAKYLKKNLHYKH